MVEHRRQVIKAVKQDKDAALGRICNTLAGRGSARSPLLLVQLSQFLAYFQAQGVILSQLHQWRWHSQGLEEAEKSTSNVVNSLRDDYATFVWFCRRVCQRFKVSLAARQHEKVGCNHLEAPQVLICHMQYFVGLVSSNHLLRELLHH